MLRTLFFLKFIFSCHLIQLPVTYHISANNLLFLLLAILSCILQWFVEPHSFPPTSDFSSSLNFVEHRTSTAKIQIWLYPLLVQYVHTFVLLFILSYVYICSWHSPYLTVHLTFTTVCFMLVPYILLNTIFSSRMSYYPGNTPWFIEYFNFSSNFTFFHHIDYISLLLIPFLLRASFFLYSSFPAT